LLNVLRSWFIVVRDYPPHDVKFPDKKELERRMEFYLAHPVDISNFKPWEILVGHFHDSPFLLNQRYSIAQIDTRVRIITFLREPLEHRLSLYFYAKRRNHNWIKDVGLKQFLNSPYHQNYFARALQCDETNYEKVLSGYYFIGLVEEFENSIRFLASDLKRPFSRKIPHLNRTERMKSPELESIDLDEFKKLNALDYKLYEYAKSRKVG